MSKIIGGKNGKVTRWIMRSDGESVQVSEDAYAFFKEARELMLLLESAQDSSFSAHGMSIEILLHIAEEFLAQGLIKAPKPEKITLHAMGGSYPVTLPAQAECITFLGYRAEILQQAPHPQPKPKAKKLKKEKQKDADSVQEITIIDSGEITAAKIAIDPGSLGSIEPSDFIEGIKNFYNALGGSAAIAGNMALSKSIIGNAKPQDWCLTCQSTKHKTEDCGSYCKTCDKPFSSCDCDDTIPF